LLALEDGTVYRGLGFGSAADLTGELVFNTAHERLPRGADRSSYRGQIVMMTAPEIGNVGVNPEDFESDRPYCAGFVVRDLSPRVSNWRAQGTLAGLMEKSGVAGITGIDTRAITRRLRIGGAQRAVITRKIDDPTRRWPWPGARLRWRARPGQGQ